MWQPKDFKITITKTTCYHSRCVGQDRMLSQVKTDQWVSEDTRFWSIPFLQLLTHFLNLCLIKRLWYTFFQMLIISNGRIGQKRLIVSFENSVNVFLVQQDSFSIIILLDSWWQFDPLRVNYCCRKKAKKTWGDIPYRHCFSHLFWGETLKE